MFEDQNITGGYNLIFSIAKKGTIEYCDKYLIFNYIFILFGIYALHILFNAILMYSRREQRGEFKFSSRNIKSKIIKN